MSSAARIRALAELLPPETRPDEAPLAEVVDRIGGELHWPRWENRGRGVTAASQDGPAPARDADPAWFASEGGPFTAVFEAPPVDGAGRPLAGLTFAVKDLISVAGHRLGAGSAVRDDAEPEPADAKIVARLRTLGAALLGTTTLHEFAFGVTGLNAHVGTAGNPVDPDRVPGGSSSGSAVAVANGSVSFALGTDTGGSVRIPAALCGVVGYKPSCDTYPTDGVFPLSPTLDHVGLVARDVATVTRVHETLALPVNGTLDVRRIGVVEAELEAADGDVADRVAAAVRRFESGGATVSNVDWPVGDEVFAVSTAIMFSEAAAIHRDELLARPTDYGSDVRARLLQGLACRLRRRAPDEGGTAREDEPDARRCRLRRRPDGRCPRTAHRGGGLARGRRSARREHAARQRGRRARDLPAAARRRASRRTAGHRRR